MIEQQRENENLIQEPRYPRHGWIGVDLDGTLAKCESDPNPIAIGPPIPLMHKRVLHWLRTGREVKIFTARAGDEEQRKLVERWCEKHGLANLEITDRKDFRMVALWDDRAIGVVTNSGIPILPSRLTFWQSLMLLFSKFVRGQPIVAINQAQLRGQSDVAMDYGRKSLER